MKVRDNKKFYESIKEKVDFIYELTKDGFDEAFKQFDNRLLDEVLAEIVRCGALTKTAIYTRGCGRKFHFKWNDNAPAPTTTFYKNIAKAVADVHDRKSERWRQAKRAQREREKAMIESKAEEQERIENIERMKSNLLEKQKEAEKIDSAVQSYYLRSKGINDVKVPSSKACVTISAFTDQELWNELKNRGYTIDNEKLVKKTYLE